MSEGNSLGVEFLEERKYVERPSFLTEQEEEKRRQEMERKKSEAFLKAQELYLIYRGIPKGRKMVAGVEETSGEATERKRNTKLTFRWMTHKENPDALPNSKKLREAWENSPTLIERTLVLVNEMNEGEGLQELIAKKEWVALFKKFQDILNDYGNIHDFPPHPEESMFD